MQKTGFALSATLACLFLLALLAPVPDTAPKGVPGLDKIVHFTFFFLIALPGLSVAPRSWVWMVPLVITYGGMIEIIQPFFGRGAELGDFIANSLGVICAVPIGRWVFVSWLESW